MRRKRARKVESDNVDDIMNLITPKKPEHSVDTTVQEMHDENNQEFMKATYQAAVYQSLTDDDTGARLLRDIKDEGDRASLVREAAYAIQEQAFNTLMQELKILAASISMLKSEKSGATCVNLFDVLQRMYIESIWLQRRIRSLLAINLDEIDEIYSSESKAFEYESLALILKLGKYSQFPESDLDATQAMFQDMSHTQVRSIQRNRTFRNNANEILAEEFRPSTGPEPQTVSESHASDKIAELYDKLGDDIAVSHLIDILTINTDTPVEEIVERARKIHRELTGRSSL